MSGHRICKQCLFLPAPVINSAQIPPQTMNQFSRVQVRLNKKSQRLCVCLHVLFLLPDYFHHRKTFPWCVSPRGALSPEPCPEPLCCTCLSGSQGMGPRALPLLCQAGPGMLLRSCNCTAEALLGFFFWFLLLFNSVLSLLPLPYRIQLLKAVLASQKKE